MRKIGSNRPMEKAVERMVQETGDYRSGLAGFNPGQIIEYLIPIILAILLSIVAPIYCISTKWKLCGFCQDKLILSVLTFMISSYRRPLLLSKRWFQVSIWGALKHLSKEVAVNTRIYDRIDSLYYY